MHLTSEVMDEYAQLWNDEGGALDAQDEQAGVVVVGVILIDNGDLRVDPLELF